MLRHLTIPLSICLLIYLLICLLRRRRSSGACPTGSSALQPAPGPQTLVSKPPAEWNPGGPDVISEQKQWSGIQQHGGERTGRGHWPTAAYGKGVLPGICAHPTRAEGNRLGGTCLAMVSQGTSSISVPGEENQPPAVLMGMLLDGTLASAETGPRQCLLWQGSAG